MKTRSWGESSTTGTVGAQQGKQGMYDNILHIDQY